MIRAAGGLVAAVAVGLLLGLGAAVVIVTGSHLDDPLYQALAGMPVALAGACAGLAVWGWRHPS